jgi:glutamate---cysteine ligase / carboxylate-amine ligase
VNLRETFDAVAPLTVGIEEEVLLLDPATLMPKPCAAEVLDRAQGDARLKPELPAAQVELMTRPHATVAGALEELGQARAVLAAACAGIARPAAAALHPTAVGPMELMPGERYERTAALHRGVATRQLVGALQVHVAVGGADRTLAVYNALRGHLPELAALAAAAPFYEGADTGLASARPLVSTLLPRQGVPPAISSWEAFAVELDWGRRSGAVDDPGRWWFELRPHLRHGTLELRVPDVQPSLAGARAVADACFAVVRRLAERFDAGEPLESHVRWRIEENRWAALRDGVEGELADLVTGELRPTRERLRDLLGAAGAPAACDALVERNAAMELRAVGVDTAAEWLADQFIER